MKGYEIEFRQHNLPEGRERLVRALRLLLAQSRGTLVESTGGTGQGDLRKAGREGATMAPEEGMAT